MTEHEFRPHVTIDGRSLNESRGLRGLTPVADIQIKWGGTEWWENIDPSRLSLIILDPYGDLLNLKRGVDVTVTIDPDQRVLFRGTLDASRATLAKVQRANGRTTEVWRVEVEAYDPTAMLAADRRHGPYYLSRNGQVNKLHWGRSLIRERHEDLQRRSRVPIAWRYPQWMATMDDILGVPDNPVAPYTLQQNVSVLTVLRQTARIENPLNRPYFDHQRGDIQLLKARTAASTPADNASIALANGEAVISRVISTIPPTELNGASLIADSGRIALDLKPQDQLTRCTLRSRFLMLRPADQAAGISGTHYEVAELEPPKTLAVSGDAESTVELETDLIFTFNAGIPAALYSGVQTLMQSTHEFRLPPSFKFRITPSTPANERINLVKLLRAQPLYDQTTGELAPFVIVNTPLQWAGSLPSFSVVGGELRYTDKRGWEITCFPATVPTQPASGRQLNSVTLTTPISRTAARYTVGDFQVI